MEKLHQIRRDKTLCLNKVASEEVTLRVFACVLWENNNSFPPRNVKAVIVIVMIARVGLDCRLGLADCKCLKLDHMLSLSSSEARRTLCVCLSPSYCPSVWSRDVWEGLDVCFAAASDKASIILRVWFSRCARVLYESSERLWRLCQGTGHVCKTNKRDFITSLVTWSIKCKTVGFYVS